MTAELVKAFNSLPRKEKTPSGLVPNEWHFDIRYVHLEPTPSHVLVFVQPQSQLIHMERLPVGLPMDAAGIVFFPESGKEAAPEAAKGILHSFVNNMGNNVMGARAPPPFAPWKLTEDRSLAVAVGNELKRLGVRPDGVCNIGVSRPSVNKLADTVFTRVFSRLKETIFPERLVRDVISTPTSIGFENFKLDDPPLNMHDLNGVPDLLMKYVQLWKNCEPPGPESNSSAVLGDIQLGMAMLERKLIEKPEALIKGQADRGSPEAALDYGLRLYFGLTCKRDRTLARSYIIKAITSPDASDELMAIAHGILIEWCIFSARFNLRSRYLFAASHHANASARLGRRATPNPALPASSAVLWFMNTFFEPLSVKHPELYFFFKDAIAAMNERQKQVESGRKKMQAKRMKKPNRYRCAAVGCGVEADSGKMLSKCAGKCDPDKKPSYCSKECQKLDWKNHKPYCLPGAECSVIDDSFGSSAPSSKSGPGSLQVPITTANGSQMTISSSTFDAKTLKEIREHAAEWESGNITHLPSSLNIELERLEIRDPDAEDE
ncbi:hypothetical protein M413DRAFT_445548 [Hebeloma cylindrosporum]|uniref:MYND-type domain-containing protein n=1 Tax=Hebeloma cylindrosporum TaxID=76867 RepID=A0A0C3CD95_HEBCY|nr:hypothetical protein M413DRAFT_445548 [Hebeloma cylindrosporum h7]